MKIPISVIIIARNEEGMISRAVASADFADDVLVVDAFSTDATVERARQAGARVVQRAWTNFGEQRNFSLQQAEHEWVFILDADEAITPGLQKWLEDFFLGLNGAPGQNAIGSAEDFRAFSSGTRHGYKIKRAEYFLGRRIYGACWNPSYQDRLFRKSKARYVGEIHEYPVVEGGMAFAPETALIDHNPNVTVESFLEKMNRYTTVEAFDRYQAGQRTSISHLCVVFFSNWAKNFFYYKGYRDGAYGFVICLMEAVSRTVRHIKLWQIQRMTEEGKESLLPNPKRSLDSGAVMHRKLESRPQEDRL